MPELSLPAKNLIEKYQAEKEKSKSKEASPLIHVEEVVLKVASFYEKIRKIIDWKEEHLIKRSAIRRILKRRLFLSQEKKDISEPLVLELVRGGYFPNDQIEETKIEEVEKALKRYFYILEKSSPAFPEKEKIRLYSWLIDLASYEIEEILSPPDKEKALIDCMAESISEKIEIKEKKIISIRGISEEEKKKQVYIACQRALFKLDAPIIGYHLLKKRYPQWKTLSAVEEDKSSSSPTELLRSKSEGKEENEVLFAFAATRVADLKQITQNIYPVQREIEKELNHPLANKLYRICEKYRIPYLLLGDLLENLKGDYQKISQPEKLEELIKKNYKKRLDDLKKVLSRSAVYAILSVFFLRSVLFFVLEVPFARLTGQTFSLSATGINILGPALLMLLFLAAIKPPQKSNQERILLETIKIIYQTEKKDLYEVKIPQKKGFFIKILGAFLYFAGAIVSLGAATTIFKLAKLPLSSIVINIVFLALIAFVGLAIKNKGEDFSKNEEKKIGFFSFIFDALFLPLVNLGHWLSGKWKKHNTLTVFFNALIDLPFQVFIELLEQWIYFLKEKKEKLR